MDDLAGNMKILVTGHDGYIGCAVVPVLQGAGHHVVGLDTFLYEGCSLGPPPPTIAGPRIDIRDARAEMLVGFDAVVHLAGISNDPLGDLHPEVTYGINHLGTTSIARAAKRAGVTRFVFSSSCSLYGAQGDAPIDESAQFNPVTPYGHSKVLAERDLTALADDNFSPTFLRNATAYGFSSRLRGDLVVNNLVAYAVTTGSVFLKSNGMAWRPLVHIQDIAQAILAVIQAPREQVHLEAFNVGDTDENYRVRDVADIVAGLVPGSRVAYADGAGADTRNYRVDCGKIRSILPGFRPAWSVRDGVVELRDAYLKYGLTIDDVSGPAYGRVERVRSLIAAGLLDESLRWAKADEEVDDELVAQG